MAMSFARPDPSSPASVADAGFGTSRRGFDQTEVRDFLRMVAAELGRLQERERFLERELRTAQTNPDLDNVRFDDATLTRLLGEETARVLSTAREASTEIREKAEQNAARLLSEASDEAVRMRQEAEVESSRRRADAASDAEAELAMAKQQGREMVNEARAYRERVLSELARRRELAREQIEQLMHGRDRLMQAFERARIVAVDVVAELKPLGEPDEYVNLSPTTGPVPVMLPNTRRPDEPTDLHTPHLIIEQDTMILQTVVPDPDVDDEVTPDDEVADDAGEESPATAGDVDAESPPDGDADAETPDAETPDADVPDAGDANSGTPNIEIVSIELIDVELVDGEMVEVEMVDVEMVEVEMIGETADVEADGERDDVVVDLFARIRAEADAGVSTGSGDGPSSDDVSTDAPDAADTPDGPDGAGAGEADESPFRRRDAELTPLIVASARKLKRVLADEQNEVLDGLRRGTAVLPSRDQHTARFAEAIDDELRAAAAAGAASVATGRAAKLSKSQTGERRRRRPRRPRRVAGEPAARAARTVSRRGRGRQRRHRQEHPLGVPRMEDAAHRRTTRRRAAHDPRPGRARRPSRWCPGVLGCRCRTPGVRRRRRQRTGRMRGRRHPVSDRPSVRTVTHGVPMPTRAC